MKFHEPFTTIFNGCIKILECQLNDSFSSGKRHTAPCHEEEQQKERLHSCIPLLSLLGKISIKKSLLHYKSWVVMVLFGRHWLIAAAACLVI
jgi:hypothetical protein